MFYIYTFYYYLRLTIITNLLLCYHSSFSRILIDNYFLRNKGKQDPNSDHKSQFLHATEMWPCQKCKKRTWTLWRCGTGEDGFGFLTNISILQEHGIKYRLLSIAQNRMVAFGQVSQQVNQTVGRLVRPCHTRTAKGRMRGLRCGGLGAKRDGGASQEGRRNLKENLSYKIYIHMGAFSNVLLIHTYGPSDSSLDQIVRAFTYLTL